MNILLILFQPFVSTLTDFICILLLLIKYALLWLKFKHHIPNSFVDPDDDDASFFWPAMIIPEAELDQFCASVSDGGKVKVQLPDVGEFLVAYFEDASLFVVLPFLPF